jgi:hypothetical protein
MPDSSQQVPVIAVAAVPFSHQAARGADEGRPVMVTGAVPEQVAACQLIAEQISQRLSST